MPTTFVQLQLPLTEYQELVMCQWIYRLFYPYSKENLFVPTREQ